MKSDGDDSRTGRPGRNVDDGTRPRAAAEVAREGKTKEEEKGQLLYKLRVLNAMLWLGVGQRAVRLDELDMQLMAEWCLYST